MDFETSPTAKYDTPESAGDDNHSEKTGSEGSEGFVKVDPEMEEPTEQPSPVEEVTRSHPSAETLSASTPVEKNHLVVDLLFWRDVRVSAFTFAFSLLVLLSLRCFSVIAVIAYLSLALLAVTISFRLYKFVLQTINGTQQPNPFQSLLDADVSLSQQQVQRYTEVILSHLNCLVTCARDLVLVKSIAGSLKFGVLMWLLTYLGSWFNGLTLLTLDVLFAFILPPVYERYQTPIDTYYNLACTKVGDVYKMVKSKIPGGAKQKTQ